MLRFASQENEIASMTVGKPAIAPVRFRGYWTLMGALGVGFLPVSLFFASSFDQYGSAEISDSQVPGASPRQQIEAIAGVFESQPPPLGKLSSGEQ